MTKRKDKRPVITDGHHRISAAAASRGTSKAAPRPKAPVPWAWRDLLGLPEDVTHEAALTECRKLVRETAARNSRLAELVQKLKDAEGTEGILRTRIAQLEEERTVASAPALPLAEALALAITCVENAMPGLDLAAPAGMKGRRETLAQLKASLEVAPKPSAPAAEPHAPVEAPPPDAMVGVRALYVQPSDGRVVPALVTGRVGLPVANEYAAEYDLIVFNGGPTSARVYGARGTMGNAPGQWLAVTG